MRSTSASSAAAPAGGSSSCAETNDMTTMNCISRKNSTRSIWPLRSLSKIATKRRHCSSSMSHGFASLIETITGTSSSGVSAPDESTSSAS